MVDHTLDHILLVNRVSKIVKVWTGGNGFLYYIPMWMMIMLYSMRLLESYEEAASDQLSVHGSTDISYCPSFREPESRQTVFTVNFYTVFNMFMLHEYLKLSFLSDINPQADIFSDKHGMEKSGRSSKLTTEN